MESPLNHHSNQTGKPDCLDISPERLKKMSPSELEQAMEDALSIMTEEDYDPAVIDAYLNALDDQVPMPMYPDAKTSYTDFQQKVRSLSGDPSVQGMQKRRHVRLHRIPRVGLVAALTVACLFGSMVAAQAAGVDVFGALARWTESAFSFGPIQSGQGVETQSAAGQEMNISSNPSELPIEYQELWNELKVLGINSLMFPTYIPDGFQVEETDLYLQPEFNMLDFYVWYKNGNDNITLNILYSEETSGMYEKDQQDVELYESKGSEYYIFSNNGENVAAWYKDDLEYSLSTTISVPELKTILDSMYSGVTKNEI
ncbi:DUF4367 domain-containing protein [Pseudoflavonifractor sp. An184]|uniref:DUF4367 domain-containing protein n=1 Tax=Pseudoflavonifractor sp. An184 TaxID=1965576 RepID=UPI000B36A7C0|nr:DUF4367 domain-containing protein [Pseudoflavonifractor sp. An184]OUP55310.1 hypothetical protein B5F19_09120 [Pseudoflavonifractor sp. An184]